MNELTSRQKSIINALVNEDDYMTASELATLIGVSVRTIKTEIGLLSEYFEQYDGHIISKHGKGYLLDVGNSNFDMTQIKVDNNDLNYIPVSYFERLNYVIRKLLVVDYHIKIEDLADELYVSRSSLTQLLKDVRERLLSFRLKLISRTNYGIIIEGTEIDKRLAISEYFFHQNEEIDYKLSSAMVLDNQGYKDEHNNLVVIIQNVCNEYAIELSDFSIHNLAIHTNVAIRRITFYNYVKVNEASLFNIQNSIEFKAASSLIKHLEKRYGFLLPIGEVVYFAQHLQTKRILDKNRISSSDTIKLESCIRVIFSEINNNFELNLSMDSDLYNYLFLHIPQMVMRLQYHMTIRNPLVNDNMRRYLFATKVTHSACAVVKQFYDVDVDLNEFGYLLLYFNLAITKFESNKPIRIGVLTGRGRPEALMYFNEITEHFSSKKYSIEEIDYIGPTTTYDLIISTYKVDNDYNQRIITINHDDYLEDIQANLNEIRYHNLDVSLFFKQEYTYFDLDVDTKEEALNQFYKILQNRNIIKEIPQDYNAFIDDELGNGIVHFQDSFRIVRKSLCFIVTLKKPIYWNKNLVRVFILTKTKKEYDKDLFNLCRIVSKWANDPFRVNDLIKQQTFETLYEGITKI